MLLSANDVKDHPELFEGLTIDGYISPKGRIHKETVSDIAGALTQLAAWESGPNIFRPLTKINGQLHIPVGLGRKPVPPQISKTDYLGIRAWERYERQLSRPVQFEDRVAMFTDLQENWQDTLQGRVTTPARILETDKQLIALIPWLEKSTNLFASTYEGDDKGRLAWFGKQALGMAKAAQTVLRTPYIFIDFHLENLLHQTGSNAYERIVLTDIEGFSPRYLNPPGDYRDERAISYHWSPEILRGGEIGPHSTVFSLGASMQWLLWGTTRQQEDTQESRVYQPIIDACKEKDYRNRPAVEEVVDTLKEKLDQLT